MKVDPSSAAKTESPMARLDRAFRAVLTVSKEALLKEEAKLKRQRAKKKPSGDLRGA